MLMDVFRPQINTDWHEFSFGTVQLISKKSAVSMAFNAELTAPLYRFIIRDSYLTS